MMLVDQLDERKRSNILSQNKRQAENPLPLLALIGQNFSR